MCLPDKTKWAITQDCPYDLRITKKEMLKWQAEDVVRQAMQNSPEFKQAVQQTMKELGQVQKNASNIISGKGKR